ncbi:MAG: DUF559 domain-containing protein [Chloroflexia bacterium]|nr:DUF559 domain-containing protein [Chloroflexia bacterium]
MSGHDVAAARDLRQRQTAAEERLWQAIRDRRLGGVKFRRQHPVGRFVLDFCAPALRLTVELDGGVHQADDVAAADAERQAFVGAAGYRFLRFPNEAIWIDLAGVLAVIQTEADRIRVDRSDPNPAG